MKTQLEQLKKQSDPGLILRMDNFKEKVSKLSYEFLMKYYKLIVCDSSENRWRKSYVGHLIIIMDINKLSA